MWPDAPVVMLAVTRGQRMSKPRGKLQPDREPIAWLALIILICALFLMVVHFWAQARDYEKRCSFIPDNMLELNDG